MDSGRHTILIVDDEEENIELVERKLSGATYFCFGEKNSEKVLAVALREHPDLIIMDWQMPILNGIEVLKRIKQETTIASIPVIIMTGYVNGPENVQTAMNAGASGFLSKPFDSTELNSCVTSVLVLGSDHHITH
jgi:two-component system phosphate regulon response regulator PhoB